MTTTRSDIAAGTGERRLHPWSWLFVLIQQLKSFALPLLVLLFTGRGNSWELWGLAGAGVLVVVSLAQYFTFRFRVDDDGLVIRKGILQRSLRHIPYQRVHNVALHQTLLHRIFGVAEVRLESAGGGIQAEAEMRVLSLPDAQALEMLVRHRGRAAASVQAAGSQVDTVVAGDEPAPQVLLQLPTSEVVRLGLISNRGMLLVLAGIGVLAQVAPSSLGDVSEETAKAAMGYGSQLELGLLGWAIGALVLVLLAVVALRILSIAHALLQFHGFVLTETGVRLSAQRGLLTRMRANMPRRRIQAWSLSESMLHRWFRRRSLRVDSASVDNAQGQRSLRDLAPVATPQAIDGLVRHLLPQATWPPAQWRRLHPKAWRRQFAIPAVATLLLTGVLAWNGVPWAPAVLVLLPVWVLRAVVWARHAGWSDDGGIVAVREGWLDRHWRFAEIGKLQALRLERSPFDRRHGMASLLIDTAGANPLEPALRIRYLPEDEARALYARLAAAMALTRARSAG